jgi:hypothetical protein
MAGITLAQAQTMLTASIAALTAAMSVKSYTISTRSKTNPEVDALQRQVEYWEAKVKELTRGGRAIRGITPC